MSTETAQQSSTLHFLDYWRVIRSRKEIVLAVAILVVLTGTVYTLMLPNIYRSQVRISVYEDSPEINPFAGQQIYGTSYNPYFLRTQFEIIQSKPILYEVVTRLNLQQEWGKEGEKLPREVAYKILANSVNVIQQRDTTLIVISVNRDNPDEAADIANELAEVYRDSRLDVALRDAKGAIDKIEQAVKDQLLRVEDAEDKVQNLRTTLDIAVMGGEGSIDVDEIRLQQMEGDRLAAQSEMLDKESLIKTLESLKDEDLIEQASYITFDQIVVSTVQQIQDIDVQLSSLDADFGVNHPEVKRYALQKSKLEETLKQRLRALRNGLQTDYILAKSRFESLDKALAGVRSTSIESQGEKYRPFRIALAELETERFIYNQLMSKHRQEIITLEVPGNPVEIIDVAEPNRRPVSPNLFMNVLLSIFVGLGAGVGLAYFIEYLDTSIKTADDVERILGLPVLGLIPQKVRPLIEEGPDSEHAEAYRVLRTNLAFTEGGATHGAFSVLSGGAGEGKSTTVFNLAFVCAQQGEKVLLVDADLRRPVQHTILGVSNRFGLTNVLLRDVPVEEAIKATSVPNLHFLPSGRLPRTSLGVLDPKRIGELIASLKTKYDVVLIDTPPLVGISDSSIIAKETDGAIIVVQYRKYPREMLMKAKHMIEALGVSVVGAVLNNINVMRDDYYYYYHSYYSDYYHSSQSDVMSDDNV
ncbi:Tyrosine-protein kinase YwqD [Pontiella desulfatans]|uniref:non-specific protein-tyrosine kinase n=1 Tax=Pontiella desulfatans TaxID=2750659 RepID=A0A6C2U5Z6_PONDE|nr:polysaccharide biosynthesis tyrosine autokinase [Pontiella desulfatans]VGO15502.1 Tyrosine-protein kinase YwqD [Pontiella desulfatans]